MERYVRTPHAETTELDGDWIILNTSLLTVTTLNALGGYCWSLLEHHQTAGSLIEALQADHETTVSLEVIEDFLDDLRTCGLIEHAS